MQRGTEVVALVTSTTIVVAAQETADCYVLVTGVSIHANNNRDTIASAAERRGNNLKSFDHFYLKAFTPESQSQNDLKVETRIWPCLSYVCHSRSTAEPNLHQLQMIQQLSLLQTRRCVQREHHTCPQTGVHNATGTPTHKPLFAMQRPSAHTPWLQGSPIC